MPPTAIRVNPKPSCMPVPNSAVMMSSSEKPLDPSGLRVVMSPMALTDTMSARSSSSTPAYSPRSVSMYR